MVDGTVLDEVVEVVKDISEVTVLVKDVEEVEVAGDVM